MPPHQDPTRTRGVKDRQSARNAPPPIERTLQRALVWLRRDLRVHDHAALYHALRNAREVWCAFVFDRAILDALPRADRRVEFIRESLVELDAGLQAASGKPGAGLVVRHGFAADVFHMENPVQIKMFLWNAAIA